MIMRQPASVESAVAAVAIVPADDAAEAKSQQNIEMPMPANGTRRAETSPRSRRALRMEPTPTPTANTVSNSVRTVPSECSVSRAMTGNSVINVAPMVQNQDRLSTANQIVRTEAAWRVIRQVSPMMFSEMCSDGSAGGTAGICIADHIPSHGKCQAHEADPGGAVRQQYQRAARDGARDNG